MADLAKSAVTIIERWREGGTTSNKFSAKAFQLVLTGQGSATNKILATTLGFSKIWSVRDARTDSDGPILAHPSYDGSYIRLYAPDAPAVDTGDDFTDTIRLTVIGKD